MPLGLYHKELVLGVGLPSSKFVFGCCVRAAVLRSGVEGSGRRCEMQSRLWWLILYRLHYVCVQLPRVSCDSS